MRFSLFISYSRQDARSTPIYEYTFFPSYSTVSLEAQYHSGREVVTESEWNETCDDRLFEIGSLGSYFLFYLLWRQEEGHKTSFGRLQFPPAQSTMVQYFVTLQKLKTHNRVKQVDDASTFPRHCFAQKSLVPRFFSAPVDFL